MIIPVEQLNDETLRQVIREWLMREGEDWGLTDDSLDAAILKARQALLKGELVLHWDESDESLSIVAQDAL